jgi:LysM repeat protein
VQGGDTLSKIAAKYGSTVQAIAQRNNLRNVNLIYVGQRLCIP